MKILVVDDSRTMRRIIGTALKGMGYSAASIMEASDGVEALTVLREADYAVDIILADWNMPNMDGLTLLKQLQGEERLKDIPVIMLTNSINVSDLLRSYKAQASGFIGKAVDDDQFARNIEIAISYWSEAVALPSM